MAHFAKIDSNTNIVIDVNVVNNEDLNNLSYPESEAVGISYLAQWTEPNTYWKQTSYNNNFRYRYAGIGYTYDSARDAFISPQPFPSWILNESTTLWEAPVSLPDGAKESDYNWIEETQTWQLK
jgi:hypothetical protein